MKAAITTPTHPDKLTIRSGRLIGSLVNAPRFRGGRLPSSVKALAAGKFNSSAAGFREGRSEAFRQVEITSSGMIAVIGSDVPYARIHEFGGQAGRNRSVAIPARPYLTPAAAKVVASGAADRILSAAINETFKRANI